MFIWTHLSIPVAESQGHHEALQGVKEEIRVLVDGDQVTTARVYPDRRIRVRVSFKIL